MAPVRHALRRSRPGRAGRAGVHAGVATAWPLTAMNRSTSPPGRLARFGFTDTAAAGILLGPEPKGLGLWDDGEQRPVDAGAGDVLQAMAGCANPDLAL